MIKDCALYIRSDEDNFARSVAFQAKSCTAIAASHGQAIDALYLDIVDANDEHPEEFERLLADCIAGRIGVIYAVSRDRVSHLAEPLERFLRTATNCRVEVVFLEDEVGESIETI